jgi:hypothetical protein
MTLVNQVITGITRSWVVILITVVVTGVFTYLGNRGIKKYYNSAKEKERRQAKQQLHSIVEDIIINNRENLAENEVDPHKIGLSAERINDLIEASERENQVSLTNSVTPISLIQEVDMAIKDSNLLDSDQINEYSKAIEYIKSEIQEEKSSPEVPKEPLEIVNRIKENSDYEGIEEDVEDLKESISESKKVVVSTSNHFRSIQLLILSGLIASVTAVTLIEPTESNAGTDPPPEIAILITVITMAMFLAFVTLRLTEVLEEDLDDILHAFFK